LFIHCFDYAIVSRGPAVTDALRAKGIFASGWRVAIDFPARGFVWLDCGHGFPPPVVSRN
jgi:hypothetical protein